MKKVSLFAAALAALVASFGALANEYTDVIDAFDMRFNGDPFDINLRIGYETALRKSTIRREAFDHLPLAWDYFPYTDVAQFKQVTHTLKTEVEIGLFHDLSFRLALPVVLRDSRQLKDKMGNSPWSDLDGDGVPNQLFPTDFTSPDRSGIDYISAGLWWGILDQERDDTKPNWTFFLEGRFGVGETLKAGCMAGAVNCEDGMNIKGGISRGFNEIVLGTRLSRRFGYVDPYFGLEVVMGVPKEGTAYSDNDENAVNTLPPLVGSLDFGMEIIPWEQKEQGRKVVISIGGGGKYHSEGREYTPLFDVLGIFGDPEHSAANEGINNIDENGKPYVDYNSNGLPDPDGQERGAAETFSGLTDVENYASFYGKLFVSVQPAKYVKLRIGTLMGHETEHFITKTDQCDGGNLGFEDGAYQCLLPNYGHRPYLDSPGNRFRAEDTFIFNFFVDALAMF
ncbi:MAG: hypothetical protein MUC50_14150 [Myxococcota bacterium]|jgi:hypothetical protein|nr:hypothetical protein [Myxococcota bacterium]